MASRIIAQIIITATQVFSRAFVSAYQQALHNAKSGGVTATKVMKFKMQGDEAMKILNIEKEALDMKAVEAQFKKFYELNDPAKGGSFYLQSKIFRAKEALEHQLKQEARANDPAAGGPAADGASDAASASGTEPQDPKTKA